MLLLVLLLWSWNASLIRPDRLWRTQARGNGVGEVPTSTYSRIRGADAPLVVHFFLDIRTRQKLLCGLTPERRWSKAMISFRPGEVAEA